MPPPRTPPPKTTIAQLEPFTGLTLDKIAVVTTAAQAELAVAALREARVVGFDTESKPTFRKGEKSGGPHVLQFSTLGQAFVFISAHEATHPAINHLLGARDLKKVGFGLSGDLRQIANRFGIRPAATIDLDQVFRKLGYRNAVGTKSAVAILFGRRLLKSKSVTTSNWAAAALSDRQLLYAANDAYAALRIHHALQAAAPAQPAPPQP